MKRVWKWMAALVFAAVIQGAGEARAAGGDDQWFTVFDLERLEYRAKDGDDALAWEGEIRIGGDYNKIVLKAEGEYLTDPGRLENAEGQLLYRWLISDFFDLQAGLRHDFRPHPARSYAVLGFAGLAPQWVESDGSLFVSDQGDVSLRLEADYDILLTQRLVLQSAATLNAAFSDDRETGVGSGLSDIELGLRLRYEFSREIAPYVGVHWERKLGETADLTREEGGDASDLSFVLGVKIAF